MSTASYYRELRSYLRDDYGIAEVAQRSAGTGHRRWSFEYGGKPQTITLQLRRSGRSGNQLLGDQEAGHPPAARTSAAAEIGPTRETHTGEHDDGSNEQGGGIQSAAVSDLKVVDGSPSERTSAAVRVLGSVALYGGGHLRFFVPTSIAAAFNPGDLGYEIRRAAPLEWHLGVSEDPSKPKLKHYGRGLSYLAPGATVASLFSGLSPFGVSPAEYEIVDGLLRVTVDAGSIKPIKLIKPARRSTPTAVEVPGPPEPRLPAADGATSLPEGPSALGTTAGGARWIDPGFNASALVRVLESVRAVEIATPYRIKREADGKLVFAAPRIK